MNEEFPGVTAQLTVTDTAAAVAFYEEVFAADELRRNTTPDGKIMLSELLIGGGRLLLHDEFPGTPAPATLGGTPVTLHVFVADTDAVFARALAAGATALMEPMDAFWGDRYAQILDPFGHRWSLATKQDDLAPEDIADRGAAYLRDHPHQ